MIFGSTEPANACRREKDITLGINSARLHSSSAANTIPRVGSPANGTTKRNNGPRTLWGDMSAKGKSGLFGAPKQVAVERGLAEFRSGRPVIIAAGGEAVAALPVDGMTDQ